MKNCSPVRGGQQKWPRNSEGYRTRSPLRSPQSRDEDLALFHDMRTLENKNFLHPSTDDVEASLPTKLGGLTGFRICASPTPAWKGNDLLAIAESEKTDYDWLLTPPGTPLFPSLDKDSLQNYMDPYVVSQSYSAFKGSRFSGSGTPEQVRTARRSPGPRTPTSIASSTSSSQSVSRACVPSPSRVVPSPNLRPTTPSKALGRATTFVNRASTRSSPPILRRTNTSPIARSSSIERNAASSKPRNSVSPKLQAWQASELGFSAEPPPNLRTSISDRPMSSSRSGTGRPRVGAQEIKHHQEARRSYSDALENRRSQWRTSSSSTSRLSSSTTSQDRWSSRGSMFSSSDDGIDVMEPTFLDFCVTSPTSGTSKSVSKRFDNEVSSRCSPVSRQKKSSIATVETVRISASARKSLDSCMQRADHSRVSQSMFRPLMSSAPTTSYCNIGRSAARYKPANCSVEPSITASSNASSERGARIFPGCESSEEEVESEYDKNITAAASTSNSVLRESDLADANSHPVHDAVEQYEQESVADSSSTTMDAYEQERVMSLPSHEWERIRAKGRPVHGEGDQNEGMPKHFVEKHIPTSAEHSIDQDTSRGDAQESSADSPSNRDNGGKVSACLRPDPINRLSSDCGEEETEVYGLCHEGAIPYATNDADSENKNRESTTSSAVLPPERHGNAPGDHCAEQIRMDSTASDSNSDSFVQESTLYLKSHASRLDVCIDEAHLLVHASSLKASIKVSGQQSTTSVFVLQDSSMQVVGKSSPKCAILFEEESAIENIPSCFESIVAGHVTNEQFQSGALTMEGEKPFHILESEGYISNFSSSMPKSDQPSSLAGKMTSAFEASCGKDDPATAEEIKEISYINKPGLVATPGKPLQAVDNEFADLKNFWSPDGTEVDPFKYNEEITTDSECRTGHANLLPGNEALEAPSQGDRKNFPTCNALADLLSSSLDPGPQDNEHFLIVASMVAESSIDCSLVVEVSEEEHLLNSASLQNIPQFPGDSQPDGSLQEGTQTGASSAIEGAEVESTVSESNTLNKADNQQQPQRGSPRKKSAESIVHRGVTSSFSLEEATNTILFCSSIIHDLVYEAASIASEKEAEAMKVASPLVLQGRGLNANSAFISSLREKISKSATWKTRQKEAKAFSVKLQKEENAVPSAIITEYPAPMPAMVREPVRVEADKPLPDNSKEKSFMGMSVNNNCQCSIM